MRPQYDPRDTEPRCGLRRSMTAITHPTATSMMMITVAALPTSALKSAPETSKGAVETCASGATREARALRQKTANQRAHCRRTLESTAKPELRYGAPNSCEAAEV